MVHPPENGILFISDVHLGSPEFDEAALEASLIRLARHARDQGLTIVIVGDLFDYWMEYPGGVVPPVGRRFLEFMREWHVETGRRTLYLTGNHDNWILGHFAELGFDVEPECRLLEASGRRILVAHGDGLASPEWDLPRPLAHRLLRHPRFSGIFRALFPPERGWALMRWYSGLSRGLTPRSTEELDLAARRWLQRPGVDMVVCGHDHVARFIRFDGGEYVNCGVFGSDRCAVLLNDDGPVLVAWNDSENKLVPLPQSMVPHTERRPPL